jgi:hypothetical protein
MHQREVPVMAMLKVLALALAGGTLFTGLGICGLDWIEKSTGHGATVFIVGFGCVGLLLGAIAGAAQTVVDALNSAAAHDHR